MIPLRKMPQEIRLFAQAVAPTNRKEWFAYIATAIVVFGPLVMRLLRAW